VPCVNVEGMYRPDWIRFTWNLDSLDLTAATPDHLPEVRLGEPGEGPSFWEAMERSFKTENAWGSLFQERIDECKQWAPNPIEGKDVRSVVLVDGKRVVGGCLLNTDAEALRQLVSGVFVVEEYRCRGAGEAVLRCALKELKAAGLKHAAVVTRSNVSAAKFLYPKLSSFSEKLKEMPTLKQAA